MSELGILLGFFVLVLGGVSAAGYFLLQRGAASDDDSGVATLPNAPSETLRQTLKSFGALVPKRSAHVDRYRVLLSHAGYRHPDALTTFFGIKAVTILGFASVCSLCSMLATGDSAGVVLAIVAGAGIGHLLPDRILRSSQSRRERQIRHSLPVALELMILCMEAGQSIDAAISETARELIDSHPALAEEFNLVLMEMLASRSRGEALRALMERNNEPEMKRIAQVLIDGDRFGTSLATALRNQLRFLRTRMRQHAQEQARKVSVKLVFPIFFLIFPAILLVTLGPALLQVFSGLTRMLGNSGL